MATVRRQVGDILLFVDRDNGRWVYASGPSFPVVVPHDRRIPPPHDGAVLYRTDLSAFYQWSEATATWVLIGGGGSAGTNVAGISNLGNTSGTTGVVSDTAIRVLLAGGNNVTLSQSLDGASATITISAGAGGGAAFTAGVSTGGNTAGDTGTVSNRIIFAGGNNVTLSQATAAGGATVTISGANTVAQTVQPGIQSVSAGTTRATTGEVVFSNSNGLAFGLDGQTLTGSYTVPTVPGQFTGGFSTQGNTAGDTGLVTGRVLLVGGNNVTLSGSTNAGSITITISGGAAGGADGFNRIAAGTQTAETLGTVVFSNSHNVTFGMSGSTRVTASASFPAETPFGISAGTQSVSTGTMVFSDSNGISFGMSGSSRITASYTVPTVPAQFSGGISGGNTAGDTGVVTGRVVFHGSNNITLSGSTNGGSQTISIIGGAGGGGAYSGGFSTQGNTSGDTGFGSGTLHLVGHNNITLSGATAAGIVTVSISGAASPTVPIISFHHVLHPAGVGTATAAIAHASMSNATLWLWPLAAGNDIFPGNMTFGTVIIPFFASHANSTASTEAHTSTVSFGIYRLNNRTQLTLAMSGSRTWGTAAANNSISSLYTGRRWLTLQGSQFDNSTLSNTNYWGALWFRTSGTQMGTASGGPVAARFPAGPITNAFSGFFFAASSSASSYAEGVPFHGVYSASFTTAMPAAIAQSEMAYTGTAWADMVPDVRLVASNASNIFGLV